MIYLITRGYQNILAAWSCDWISPASSQRDYFEDSFPTLDGSFEWLIITNAPAYFVNMMSRIFQSQLNQFVVVFVNDILVYSNDEEDHKLPLREILGILKQHKLKAKLSKCHFWGREVRF